MQQALNITLFIESRASEGEVKQFIAKHQTEQLYPLDKRHN